MFPEGSTRLMIQIVATALIVVWPVISGFMAAFVDFNAGVASLAWWFCAFMVLFILHGVYIVLEFIWKVKW